MVYLFFADGFEEIEALATVDILRRAGVEVTTVSINSGIEVMGAHNVRVCADTTMDDVNISKPEMLILPGGMPGAKNLYECSRLADLLRNENARGTKIAAICAAPAVVLAGLGLLKGHEAICYPGFEGLMKGATVSENVVVTDGNITTAMGPGFAMEFALELVRILKSDDASEQIAKGLLLI
ncbi:MAG: DJ-1/PfpI family protein [Paludibacteraceae bacterium]|nr:DJ-1/PfpI family protein [Paludibacteraceae bacterium]